MEAKMMMMKTWNGTRRMIGDKSFAMDQGGYKFLYCWLKYMHSKYYITS
jgi:hypothetical protein